MASKRQRRAQSASKRKAKPKKRLPPPPNVLLGRQGIIADPNADLAPRKRQQLVASEPVWVPSEAKPPREKRLSEWDETYLRTLLAKYGTDFEAMGRDRKLNRDQLTARQLEKMYQLLMAQETHVSEQESETSS